MSYDLREELPFIGYSTYQIIANNNLPTIKQALAVLFYNLRKVSSSIDNSAKLVIEECVIFYKRNHIPTKESHKCIEKLKKEYKNYRKITKNVGRTSKTQIKNETEYMSRLNKLFDIAKANALDEMTDENDKKFLLRQRELPTSESLNDYNPVPGKTSPMEIDEEIFNIESSKPSTSSTNQETLHVSRESPINRLFDEAVTKEGLEEIIGPESQSQPSQHTPPRKRRATEVFMTPRLAITLDYCKISKNYAMHLIMAISEALHVDTRNLILNAKSIHASRKEIRGERFEAIKRAAPNLFSHFLTVHWDSKLLPGLSRKEKNDVLAILITSMGQEQLLGVSKIESSTGKNQAHAVYQSLIDWSVHDNVEALCCDSTSSNTGSKNGACKILEELLEKDILYLICRHHILELFLRCTFEIKFGKTTGPDVGNFTKFEDFWKTANHENFDIGIADEIVAECLQDDITNILNFCLEQLKTYQPRADYKEFLELVVIFLGGGNMLKKISFHPPGATHHARWMAKGIYCLKIFLFRQQFLINNKEDEIKYRDVCIFIIKVYVQAWFSAVSAVQAPHNDLELLKKLYNYKCIDKSISQATVKKFSKHLWYLTPELAALAFFDSNVLKEEKLKMVNALKLECSSFPYQKRIIANEQNLITIINSNLSDFVCKDSLKFFERLKIDPSFLSEDPSTWQKNRMFVRGLEVIKNLKVVNDAAEREIKLITEFNNLLSKEDRQMQYLLPVIKEYRNIFPNSNKETLMKSLQYTT